MSTNQYVIVRACEKDIELGGDPNAPIFMLDREVAAGRPNSRIIDTVRAFDTNRRYAFTTSDKMYHVGRTMQAHQICALAR